MNEDQLYNLIGRMWCDLRAAAARIQQLEARVKELTPQPSPPADNAEDK